jgi:uncharacterized membrane protein
MSEQTQAQTRNRRLTAAGILLGLGLGGFFDGIVLHQILQWHHMVSNVAEYPVTTVSGLEANTLADGLFHAMTYLFTAAGLALLWRSPHGPLPMRVLIGLLLMGWGLFNLADGIVNHHILAIHHVREDVDNQLAWDLGFLAWGAIMLVGGWLLRRSGGTAPPPNDAARR